MNPYTLYIIIIAFGLALIYMIIKNKRITSLTNNIKKRDFQAVLVEAETPFNRKLLGDYHCDLFMIRAYYLMNDTENLDKKALDMLTENYNTSQRKNFLEIYYHIFLNRDDLEMAKRFLDEISKIGDKPFLKCSQYAYDVLAERQDDLIEAMDEEINAKMYSGFSLGTIVYLIAMQHLYKKEYEDAELYFEECLICFHPNAFYVDLAKRHLKDIEDIENDIT